MFPMFLGQIFYKLFIVKITFGNQIQNAIFNLEREPKKKKTELKCLIIKIQNFNAIISNLELFSAFYTSKP